MSEDRCPACEGTVKGAHHLTGCPATTMSQYAPFPEELAALVERLRYRPGWQVKLVNTERDPADTHGAAAGGLTFIVTTNTINAYRPQQKVMVNHYFIVPAATFNKASWQRWLFDCMTRVELHECMEFFALVDEHTEPGDVCSLCTHTASKHDGRDSSCHGSDACIPHRFSPKDPRLQRPFAPTHGPGDDPYVVHEVATDTQRRTSFRGEVGE